MTIKIIGYDGMDWIELDHSKVCVFW